MRTRNRRQISLAIPIAVHVPLKYSKTSVERRDENSKSRIM